ncbi:MAG: protein kinase [Candidatus Riflebacteria bacterium]|nr:protein kinase [Candidatus Riflebacteria bacterium]
MIDLTALLGTIIDGHYKLVSVVGEGSFGSVFAADELSFGRVIGQAAIKVMRPSNPDEREAVVKEVCSMAQLQHPNLLTYRSSGEIGEGLLKGCLYLVTELGIESLEKYLKRIGKVNLEEALTIAKDLASALAYLHSRNAVHRDVKPGNLLFCGNVWKLCDFGLVRAIQGSRMEASGRKGTALYMSPEALLGETGPHTDMWSFGVLLQEALTHIMPFSGNSESEVILKIATELPEIPNDLPKPFNHIVRGCLIRSRQQRYTAQAVLEALDPQSEENSSQNISQIQIVSIPLKDCPQCGERNPENAKFCQNCGTPLQEKYSLPQVIEKSKSLPNTMQQKLFRDSKKLKSLSESKFKSRLTNVQAKKEALQSRFTRDSNGVITDTKTNLQWCHGPRADWDRAKYWAGSLKIDGGGWRLPTMAELKTLYPDAWSTGFFKGGSAWSSELKGDLCAWQYFFSYGNEGWISRSATTVETLAVRSDSENFLPTQGFSGTNGTRSQNQSIGDSDQFNTPTPYKGIKPKRFIKDGHGIINDSKTDLQWFNGRRGGNWYEAGNWAVSFEMEGGGWRLPTLLELEGLFPDAWPTVLFENCVVWSSDLKDDSCAWGFNLMSGDKSWSHRGNSYNYGTLAVRSRK